MSSFLGSIKGPPHLTIASSRTSGAILNRARREVEGYLVNQCRGPSHLEALANPKGLGIETSSVPFCSMTCLGSVGSKAAFDFISSLSLLKCTDMAQQPP